MEDRKLFYNIVIHSIHKMPYLDETANNLYFYDELNELGQNKYIIMNVREYDITFKYTYDYNIKGSNINKIHYDIILSGEKKILKQNLAYEFKDEYIGRFTERKKEKMELIEKQSLKFLLLDSFLCIDNINEKHLKNIKNYRNTFLRYFFGFVSILVTTLEVQGLFQNFFWFFNFGVVSCRFCGLS